MKFKANISLKLAGFLLAICIPPFLLYQILTFSIVRDTMVEMASKNSMNLLIDQEVYLSQQLDHIEDLLRNISAIEEIKQAIRRADAEASGTPLRSAQSDPISTIDQSASFPSFGRPGVPMTASQAIVPMMAGIVHVRNPNEPPSTPLGPASPEGPPFTHRNAPIELSLKKIPSKMWAFQET